MPVLDINEIKKILPHRYPLLLVDRILEVEPMKRAVGPCTSCEITANTSSERVSVMMVPPTAIFTDRL